MPRLSQTMNSPQMACSKMDHELYGLNGFTRKGSFIWKMMDGGVRKLSCCERLWVCLALWQPEHSATWHESNARSSSFFPNPTHDGWGKKYRDAREWRDSVDPGGFDTFRMG